MSLEPALHTALSGDMTPKFLATLDGAGEPNCVPVISIAPYDDETLVFGEIMLNKTRKNLEACGKVGLAVINDALEAWRLTGTFLGFETAGEHVEFVNETRFLRYNAYTSIRAAGVIKLESVSGKEVLPKARLLLDYASVRARALLLGNGAEHQSVMPRPVQEKFMRLSAVRAGAYRDSRGYPSTFAMMTCLAASSDRLVMADPLFRSGAAECTPGSRLAVSVITMEPIAYQVKGVYQGKRCGMGVLDLDACYSASPPLCGDRLDKGDAASEAQGGVAATKGPSGISHSPSP